MDCLTFDIGPQKKKKCVKMSNTIAIVETLRALNTHLHLSLYDMLARDINKDTGHALVK